MRLTRRLALSLVVLRSPGGAHLSAAGQQATAHVSSKDHQAWQQTVEAYTAAVLFAAHPIHTEAVAGVVGHAELVSAALALLALMVYLSAARAADWRLHYKMLGASVIMLWSAALAKEPGITMVSLHLYTVAMTSVCNPSTSTPGVVTQQLVLLLLSEAIRHEAESNDAHSQACLIAIKVMSWYAVSACHRKVFVAQTRPPGNKACDVRSDAMGRVVCTAQSHACCRTQT